MLLVLWWSFLLKRARPIRPLVPINAGTILIDCYWWLFAGSLVIINQHTLTQTVAIDIDT
jgi:hypothetical protein